jgi:DNA-binding transcriptional MerR regulator
MDKSVDAFRTISEVAEELDLPQHVLRFWETRFPQIKPLKRAGGRRFYRPYDVDVLRAIRRLLYGEGYTIKGVQRILKEQGPRAVIAPALTGAGAGSGIASEFPSAFPEEGRGAGWTQDLVAPATRQSPEAENAEPETLFEVANRPDACSRNDDAAIDGEASAEMVRRLSDILLDLEACELILEAARRS